jgi:hypothetical protein
MVCRLRRRPAAPPDNSKGADALDHRPKLASAVVMARKIKVPVIVAKLSFGPCLGSEPKLWTDFGG